MRLVRYSADFVILGHGGRTDAGALSDEVTEVLAPAGPSLSEENARIVRIDEGFDFLGSWEVAN